MLKKPGLEELVRELERDYARWEQRYIWRDQKIRSGRTA